MRFSLIAATLFCTTRLAVADPIDEKVAAVMADRRIPGISLAIIDGGKIVKARAYGVVAAGTNQPVTTDTLFQAGSISKPVTALAALHLVEAGQLSLDVDVNTLLKTWHVPVNEFTREHKVTVRRLLTHTAGLTVHGFPGYAVTAPMPTLLQVLDGEKPANTPPIRVDLVPGTQSRYSGGGYTVLQQLMLDLTSQPFPELMRTTVLAPLGMNASTFEQPLPSDRMALAATGHYSTGKGVRGQWHIYPEMAAAGLWTTPSDLARYAIGVEDMLHGRMTQPVISPSLTRQMLTPQPPGSGLGWGLAGAGPTLRFSHGGRDEGFDAVVIAYAETGQGAAIMINLNDDTGAVDEIVRAIVAEYRWPNFPKASLFGRRTQEFVAKALAGRYDTIIVVVAIIATLGLGLWLRRTKVRSEKST